jgi:hypothetical protein
VRLDIADFVGGIRVRVRIVRHQAALEDVVAEDEGALAEQPLLGWQRRVRQRQDGLEVVWVGRLVGVDED